MSVCKNCRHSVYHPADETNSYQPKEYYVCDLYGLTDAEDTCKDFLGVPALVFNGESQCQYCRAFERDESIEVSTGFFSTENKYYCHFRNEYVWEKSYCNLYSGISQIKKADTGFFGTKVADMCKDCRWYDKRREKDVGFLSSDVRHYCEYNRVYVKKDEWCEDFTGLSKLTKGTKEKGCRSCVFCHTYSSALSDFLIGPQKFYCENINDYVRDDKCCEYFTPHSERKFKPR